MNKPELSKWLWLLRESMRRHPEAYMTVGIILFATVMFIIAGILRAKGL